MIADLDETIKHLLIKKGGLDPVEIDIVFEMPDREWSGSISKPTVNFYLYDIHENRDLRDNEWNITRSNGRATKAKPPVRIDLSYLVTVWTNDMADQHRLLGHILATLFQHHELPDDLLQGKLKGLDWPIKTQTAQPDGVLRNSADFWSALDNQLKPSISYLVTLPLDLDVTLTAPEVSTRVLTFKGDGGQGPDEHILISGVIHRKGKPDDVVSDVTVVDKQLQMTATSNRDGVYAFRKMTFGKHTLEITPPGEKARSVSITVPAPNYSIEL